MKQAKSWRRCAVAVVLSAGGSGALAQSCDPHWLPGMGMAGTNGIINDSAMWDPDGDGPATPRVVVTGFFTVAGDVLANNIAAWDPDTGEWSALGSGLNDGGYDVAPGPDGTLYAVGVFTSAGGNAALRAARWSGGAWSAMGAGFNGLPVELLVMPGGDVLAGGSFDHSGAIVTRGIARWDGSAWSEFAGGVRAGVGGTAVSSLTFLPDGQLVVGGTFTLAGVIAANNVARWDGSAWHAMSTGFGNSVGPLTVWDSDGAGPLPAQLVAAVDSTPTKRVHQWNGTTWTQLSGGWSGSITGLGVSPAGDLVLSANTGAGYAFRRSGVSWVTLGTGLDLSVNTFTNMPDGRMFAGGMFHRAGDFGAASAAAWDGTAWAATCTGTDGSISAISRTADGGAIVCGNFKTIGDGVQAESIARWSGAQWSTLGAGRDVAVGRVIERANGEVIASGNFQTIGGVTARNIARYNGTTWVPMGSGITGVSPSYISSLVELPNGDVVAAGGFNSAGGVAVNNIAKWNGTAWSAMGSGIGAGVNDLARSTAGAIYAATDFQVGPTVVVMRWTGASWVPLGGGFNGAPNGSWIRSITVLPSGLPVVGGRFAMAGGVPAANIAYWTGTQWAPLGSGLNGNVTDVLALSDGSVIASGDFTTAGGQPAEHIAKWNGTSWAPMESGLVRVIAREILLAELAGGDVAAAGSFSTAGGRLASNFARWSLSGHPEVVNDPVDVTVNLGETFVFNATPEAGFEGVSVQWTRNGVPISNGSGGASPGGGFVQGAVADVTSPTGGSPAVLIVEQTRIGDAGDYAAIFFNDCGEATSEAATGTIIGPKCPADFDESGVVNAADVDGFINAWFADQVKGTLVADWDSSGIVNSIDVGEFINGWFVDIGNGCAG